MRRTMAAALLAATLPAWLPMSASAAPATAAVHAARPAPALARFGDPASTTAAAIQASLPGLAQAQQPQQAGTRSGLEIYQRFRQGLAQPQCEPGASARWRQHFAHVPRQLASGSSEVLPMFGYVVDALHEAYLPTEFALIPFVESGYRPGARSASGPAGLWQFIAVTARNHKVPMNAGYDGRLSPVDSTTAAVRYLKTLHGMFAGDWRLAVMAFNAGEYRVLGALKRSGQQPAGADHARLAMPEITQAYVRKLHALSCVLAEMEQEEAWLQAMDRPVPVLAPVPLATGSRNLVAHADTTGVDAALLGRLNPALVGGLPANQSELRLLSPSTGIAALRATTAVASAPPAPPAPVRRPAATPAVDRDSDISDAMAMAVMHEEPPRRTHTVSRGESPWTIARRHGIRLEELFSRNGLAAGSVLHPGMVLKIDPTP